MHLRNVEVFCDIVACRSFSKAAVARGISQPAASQVVQQLEERLGTIEKGKLADLVMLDRDLLTIPSEEIAKVKPLMTIVGGKIVFARAGIESAEPQVMQR